MSEIAVVPARSIETEKSESTELFLIRLDQFDGPIDLLLHLVKQNELPIEKLSLGLVAEQYLSCLESLENIEVEVAGEYLVIASTLLSIKAKYVLRQPIDEMQSTDDSVLVEDPHDALLRRLREAAVYKDGAEHLEDRPLLGIDVFATPGMKGGKIVALAPLKDHDPMLLGKALRALVKRKGGAPIPPMTFQFDPVSVSERMQSMLQVLVDHKAATGSSRMLFDDVVEAIGGDDLGIIITCFLALLELTRKRAVRIVQTATFEELLLMLPVDSDDVDSELVSAEEDFLETGELSAEDTAGIN